MVVKATGDYLFPGKSADVPLSSYLKTFCHTCKRAGVPYGLNGDGSLIFYDARRTAENIMLEAGHGARSSRRGILAVFWLEDAGMGENPENKKRERRRQKAQSSKDLCVFD